MRKATSRRSATWAWSSWDRSRTATRYSQLHALIVRHHQYTQSAVARRMLDRWDEHVGKFVKVLPTEYRMVLERQHLGANNEMAKLAAV